MKSFARTFIAGLVLIGMTGCAVKVDLSRYQAVSTDRDANAIAASHPFIKPRLSRDVIIESQYVTGYETAMRDYFFISNDRQRIFDVSETAPYRLRLSLHNLESTSRFYPSVFVKTKKGGYFSDPYWNYTVSNSVTAEVTSPDGRKSFYEASSGRSFTSRILFANGLPKERYLDTLYATMDDLLRQIANDVVPEGVVVSKRISVDAPDKAIFGINMGYAQGLRPQQKVIVYRPFPTIDTPQGYQVTNRGMIGMATVSDQITENGAWIVMDDSDTNSLVDLADTIRARY